MAAHPVKTERHDTVRYEHHTNTGTRRVSIYRETPGGLYVARPFMNHPRIRHWQAHLLPDLGVQVCRYDFHGEREHDYYLDVATITRDGHVWTVRDYYLDITVWDGLAANILDTDELNAAHDEGLLGAREYAQAVGSAHRTLNALAAHGYRVNDWLAGHGLTLHWDAETANA
ncbi:DUF402 domain-containing protein [Deinococcus maricopensis]|uniref:DUF402 domain-containing protein n=1 Tax=Deinococcus maricopensis (strain DSM 21211 / LMG 22137 / NRRL B-23946 / LB-34) TaxID=709986 RepID=E8U7M7_DEIML|nr:DUF402 domain-containing protein [Deinococcus maricopensis]ADV67066.1 protein of unknown function DUF402 [Deinococcus maricopensis DSM 21211]